jgi:hypothetical protein
MTPADLDRLDKKCEILETIAISWCCYTKEIAIFRELVRLARKGLEAEEKGKGQKP